MRHGMTRPASRCRRRRQSGRRGAPRARRVARGRRLRRDAGAARCAIVATELATNLVRIRAGRAAAAADRCTAGGQTRSEMLADRSRARDGRRASAACGTAISTGGTPGTGLARCGGWPPSSISIRRRRRHRGARRASAAGSSRGGRGCSMGGRLRRRRTSEIGVRRHLARRRTSDDIARDGRRRPRPRPAGGEAAHARGRRVRDDAVRPARRLLRACAPAHVAAAAARRSPARASIALGALRYAGVGNISGSLRQRRRRAAA